MNNRFLLLAALILGLGYTLSAQDTYRINLPNVTVAAGSGQVCLPIVVENFPPVAAMQFSLGWDADVLQYAGTDLGENPLGIANNGFFTPTDSTWGISFLSSTPNGIGLDTGAIILALCFEPVVEEGSSPIFFGSYLGEEFVQDGEVTVSPVITSNGSITITATADLPVLPGDTNLDSLVNADDLLNMGLGFGQTGPARANASTDFVVQTGLPWENSTPLSEVNYAHVDADGNGVIDATDQTVLENNFGLSISGFQEPTGEVTSLASVPFIYLVSDTLIGGQVSSIDVFLGDEDNPVGIGYGLSFSLQLSPEEFDLSSVNVDYVESFLGSDLLTFDGFYPSQPGLLEIALTRKDQQNSTLAGGKICTITLTPTQTASDFEADVFVTPYRYIDAAENETMLTSAITRVYVLNSVRVVEPSWASGLVISPNPATGGLINISSTTSFERVELLDLNGKKVSSYGSVSSFATDLLPAGTYFLRLTKASETVVRKIVLR